MFLKKFEKSLKSLNLKKVLKKKDLTLPPFQLGQPTGPVTSPAAAHLPYFPFPFFHCR
jgi:hypothetical protein